AVDNARMACGTMRMAVDDARHVAPSKGVLDGGQVDVENRFRLARGRGTASASHPPRDPAPNRVGQSKETTLVPRIARPGAVALVADVVGAKLVAVREQRERARELDDRVLVEQRRAGRAREIVAEQEVAVAARDINRYPRVADAAQRVDDRAGERLPALIVADPRVEQITHDVDRRSIARRPAGESVERGGG